MDPLRMGTDQCFRSDFIIILNSRRSIEDPAKLGYIKASVAVTLRPDIDT
jgi:hypothetical protein